MFSKPFLYLQKSIEKDCLMNTSSLEINEREYCIKLSKDAFDLTLVRQLIKRIQAEALFFSRIQNEEDDILSKRSQREELEGYDSLDDK